MTSLVLVGAACLLLGVLVGEEREKKRKGCG